MNKTNKGTGAGGSRTNLNGIQFEEKIYLKEWLELSGYNLVNTAGQNRSNLFEIHRNNNLIGYYGRQGRIYDALKIITNITNAKIKDILSKKINPDGFIINIEQKSLVIFEKKWQQSSGSVDEKIQTAPFKIKMFENLLSEENFTVRYEYILSEWFAQDIYRNIREYYSSNSQVSVWIEGVNLEDLNIEEYLQ